MHYYFKSFFIIKSSSGSFHEDPEDPVSFTGFSVVDYPSPTNPHKTLFKSDSEISYFLFILFLKSQANNK